MHTFTQKPTASRKTASGEPATHGRVHLEHVTESPRFGHDFARVPTHAPAVASAPTQSTINTRGDDEQQAAGRAPLHGPAEPSRSTATAAAFSGLGRPLPDGARSFFEQRFGHDFGRVRIHTGETADSSARALGARAFTAGHDIGFRQDAYRPESAEGKKLLAHELAHVVQSARNGSVRGVSRPGDSAEIEADLVATKVSAGAQAGPLHATAPAISRQPAPDENYIEFEITPGKGGGYTINSVDPKANAKWIDTALIAAGYNIYLGGFRIWLTGMRVSEWDIGIDIPSSDIDFVTDKARAINNYVYNSRADAQAAVAKTTKRAGDPLLFAYYWGAGGMVLVPTTICPATAPRATATMWQVRQDYAEYVQQALAGVAQGMLIGRVLGAAYRWARSGGGGKSPIKPPGKGNTAPVKDETPPAKGTTPPAKGDESPVQVKPGTTKTETPKADTQKTGTPKTETPKSETVKPATTGTQAPKTGPELISQTAKAPGGQAEKVKFFETNKKALEPGWVANKTGTASDGSVVYHGEKQAKALVITKEGKVFTGTWGEHVKLNVSDKGASLTCDWSLKGWKEW